MVSREIKFRAWFDNGKAQDMFFVGDAYGTVHPMDCCRYAQDGQPVTLMQYTGLKDASGVEIYENSEIDDEFVVSTKGCDYVLISISSGDIVRLQDYYSGASGNVKVTREYAGV